MPAAGNRTDQLNGEERPGFFIKLTKLNLCLLLSLVVPFCILSFRPPVAEEKAELESLAKAEARRDVLLADKTRLRRKLDLIRKDPEYLEVMARDKLKMQKDGELIFSFAD